ncbi:MAG: hypothetical protein LBC86_11125 [Oscillospiraceae bacterium]|jgi:hypothetical protein|nr:hypothetical protein [Oscillospiraceae bacterium]
MAYEIVGESVKSALGQQIMRVFPGVTWYKEQITNLRFPHFFVLQLALQSDEERKGYWWMQYLVNIRYRHVSDPTTMSTIQEALDGVALKMLTEFNTIMWDNIPVRIINPRYEKIDGVLQYFCNIRVQITKARMEEIKQMSLATNLIIET